MTNVHPSLESLKLLMEARFPDHEFDWRVIHSKSIMAKCPFHKDSSPSFGIYVRGGKAFYNCFACGHHGSANEFEESDTRTNYQISNSIFQTYLNLMNPELEDTSPSNKVVYYAIPKTPYDYYPQVQFYVENIRGIDPEVAHHWGLRGGISNYGEYQVYIPDIIVDSDNEYDYTPYFQIRWIGRKKFYLPTSSSKSLMHLTSFDRKSLTIVEGPFDALKVGDAVPLFGKFITDYQKYQLEQYLSYNPQIHDLYIILDGGKIEYDTEKALYKMLIHSIPRVLTQVRIYIGALPYDTDPGELGKDIYNYVQQVYP